MPLTEQMLFTRTKAKPLYIFYLVPQIVCVPRVDHE